MTYISNTHFAGAPTALTSICGTMNILLKLLMIIKNMDNTRIKLRSLPTTILNITDSINTTIITLEYR
jgi:uncharacterized membrane protein